MRRRKLTPATVKVEIARVFPLKSDDERFEVEYLITCRVTPEWPATHLSPAEPAEIEPINCEVLSVTDLSGLPKLGRETTALKERFTRAFWNDVYDSPDEDIRNELTRDLWAGLEE